MTLALKDISAQEELLAPGHGLCPGCAHPVVVREVLHALNKPAVVSMATGCLEVSTTRFPRTAWRTSMIHSAFENSATTIGGVEAAYKALVRRGAMEEQDIAFVVFAGDGATYDIGFQWLSGALERGHRFIYICLNNEGYMNTGIQRSGATILGAWTTTTPAGKVVPGKTEWRKDMTRIIAAHDIPFVAQTTVHSWKDLMTKVRQADAAGGPTFINVLSPCARGWRYEPQDTMSISRLAVDTCMWPLYEVDNGEWKLNYKPREKKPVTEWLKSQGRFSHLLRPENLPVVEEIQRRVDREWENLLQRCGKS
ncbi:MAG: thiamine pyrophosphate protein domain protein TPP-binding protein [Dehalococcoidia bacterium]|nr:thiamine pyrophosphate protein domain protein TPP-binding protein [Dehalococcoidia bacterium]